MNQTKKVRGMTDSGYDELRFQIAYRAVMDYQAALLRLPGAYRRIHELEQSNLPHEEKEQKLLSARNYRTNLIGYLWGTGQTYGALRYIGSPEWMADTDNMDPADVLNKIGTDAWHKACPMGQYMGRRKK